MPTTTSEALLPRSAAKPVGALTRSAGALRFAARSLRECFRVVRLGPRGERLALALLLLRMRSKHFLLKISPRWQFQRERLFGWTVECFDYFDFLCTFEILFLARDYRFTPKMPRPRILDCGSNIGLSVFWFKREFPECTITAFEPDLRTFELLRRNVEDNGLAGVTLRNQAVCGAAGDVEFCYDPSHPGSVVMSLRPDCGLPGRERVEGVLLSDCIEGPVDLLKLDIEGAELEVVEELARSGKLPHIDQMLIEYHPNLYREAGGFTRLCGILEQHGFLWEVRSGAPQPAGTANAQPVTIFARQRRPITAND
jgi:FkbM family methyltransferase